ncbi:hypothetical protein LCM20_12125 [Halobacillus litoralis]|uniref:hypothetical protein n=1 Tax=Halobacillus litoralis TaxID=45668 RepID=UPI001CD41A10|nr:hypothetical protein [Halobacillus litoralis]MCA0971345.1 hypothetical protein [Halobacillus litoralis]
MIKSFLVGSLLLFISTVVILLGLGVYSDIQDFSSYNWSFFGITVFRYESLQPDGHLLNFGVGIIAIALIGGATNAGLRSLFTRMESRT